MFIVTEGHQFESTDTMITDEEYIVDQKIVRVWKFRNIWKFILLLVIIGSVPLPSITPILFFLGLWLGFYIVRERWRLTLTNKQIIARQLFPRPLTFLTKIHHFPLKQIEGMTIGPRAFNMILLLGVFISTNLGVNLLKSGLSGDDTSDLPDILEALILLLQGMTFFDPIPQLGDDISTISQDIMDSIKSAQTGLGMFLIISGLLIVLVTIPRRYHLQIRVSHGEDFKLSAGVRKSFWENCYREMYKTKFVIAPKEYRDWNFPWLEGEEIESVTDIKRSIHINRFIGLIAIYIGLLRIYKRIISPDPFFSEDVIFWFIVASVDVFIAIVGVRFSSMRNEMVITNKRIIFAEEFKNISGSIGRRVFHLSDIKRDGVSGFRFTKLRIFSVIYLLLTIFLIGSFVIFFDQLSILAKILYIVIIIVTSFFINQTYIEFNLLTKGGEVWKMRHQLSNPATYLRNLVGSENKVMTTLLSNRLEEEEIIKTVQIIRAGDLDLKTNLFPIDRNRFSSLSLRINDLLLLDENIVYETNISRNVPRRKLTISFATLTLLFWYILAAGIFDTSENEIDIGIYRTLLLTITVISMIFLVIALWAKYYSLFNARLLLTPERIFFQDIKDPPIWLYFLGVLAEDHLSEVLRDQVHSTYNSRQFNQSVYWRLFLGHTSKWLLYVVSWGLLYGLVLSIGEISQDNSNNELIENLDILIPLFAFMLVFFGISAAWHASNAFVELIRSRPRRVFNAQGVGFHFQFPFLSKKKSDQISSAIWSGKITQE